MGALPIDFEGKVKDPKAIAAGYPYSIKAEDLMKNFVDAKLEVDDTIHSSGLQLEEYVAWGDNGHPGRAIRLTGTVTGGTPHPCQITKNAADPALVDIASATVYHETGSLAISAESALSPLDLFYVKITRDATTRAVTAAVFETQSTGFDATATNTNVYILIGSISSGVITQRWFHDLPVFEELAVVNGSFKLVTLAMVGANFYDP